MNDPRQALQRVGFLAILPPLLRDLGVDAASVLAQVGLPSTALDDPEAVIPYITMAAMLDVAAAASKCPHLGLLIGQRVSLGSLGIIGELMRNAPSLRVALRDFALQQSRHARGAAVYLLERQDHAVFGYAIYQLEVEAISQINDGAAAAAFGLVRELTGATDLCELRITISRSEPADVAPYRTYFGVVPRFEAVHTGVVMPPAWLDRPILNADAGLRKVVEAKLSSYLPAGEHDIVTQVRRAIRVGLLTGRASGNAVAEQLALARRTLHRRLAEQGSGFQELLNEARFEVAKQFLAGTCLSVGEISSIVGFAETGVFTRAFSQWAGTGPSDWRRSSRTTAVPASHPSGSQVD